MKVTVTHLKAPWPVGTAPGHVVDFAGLDAIPAWAVGKCVPAADDAEAVSSWPVVVAPAELTGEPVQQPLTAITVNLGEAGEVAGDGSGDALAPVAEAAPAAAPARKKAQAAAG